jgi:hypothetical protein
MGFLDYIIVGVVYLLLFVLLFFCVKSLIDLLK